MWVWAPLKRSDTPKVLHIQIKKQLCCANSPKIRDTRFHLKLWRLGCTIIKSRFRGMQNNIRAFCTTMSTGHWFALYSLHSLRSVSSSCCRSNCSPVCLLQWWRDCFLALLLSQVLTNTEMRGKKQISGDVLKCCRVSNFENPVASAFCHQGNPGCTHHVIFPFQH